MLFRSSADDSADSRVKVGHRQALIVGNARLINSQPGFFVFKRVESAGFLIKLANQSGIDNFGSVPPGYTCFYQLFAQ